MKFGCGLADSQWAERSKKVRQKIKKGAIEKTRETKITVKIAQFCLHNQYSKMEMPLKMRCR